MQTTSRGIVRYSLPIAGLALISGLVGVRFHRPQEPITPAVEAASAVNDPSSAPPRPAGATTAQVKGAERTGGGDPASPAETAMLLHSLRQRRDYGGMAAFVVPELRQQTIELLSAVDKVIDANAELHETARRQYGGPLAGIWDLASMADNLGLFSTHVTLINQRFKGDGATVTLQEGDQVPLVRAEFVQAGGCWRHRPEPVPTSMIVELEELARILEAINESVQQGDPFEYYEESFVLRVLPQVRRVATAEDAPSDAVAAGGDEHVP